MKILQLSPQFPFPMTDGGKIGIANIFKQFSLQGADVTFVALADPKPSKEFLAQAEKFGKIIIINHSTKNSKTRILRSAVSSTSVFMQKHISKSIINNIKEIALSENPDIVHSDHSQMAPHGLIAARKANAKVGLRLHNIEWMIWQRYADVLPWYSPEKYYVDQQAKILRQAEKYFYPKMDILLAITEEDRKRASEFAPDTPIVVASAGVNPEEFKPVTGIERNPQELILATTYDWIHNTDGAKWLIEKVLPPLKRKFRHLKFTMLGKNPTVWFENYKSLGVDPKGFVPEVQSHLSRALVYVAPLFVGAGIRIKILEGMAMELPVVATSVAAEGIHASEEYGLFVRDDRKGFAQAIDLLLCDPEKTRRIGKKAREFVLRNFTWERNVGIMLENYEKLLK